MSNQYTEQLNQINSSLDAILTDHTIADYYSRNNPTNSEYNQQLSQLEGNINTKLKLMFDLSQTIDNEIQILKNQIIQIDQNIASEKNTNASLKHDLEPTNKEDIAAKEMINDYKNIYDQRYLRNWGIALSILACVATFVIYDRKQV